MLLDHQKRSKGRVWGGTAAMGAIGLAALGLTASGTHAAERVRTTVEDRIGVKLNEINIPSFVPVAPDQQAPAAPPPVASPAPVEPNAPTAPRKQGTDAEKPAIHVFRTERDGRTIVFRSGSSMEPAELERLLAETKATRIDAEKLAADIQNQMRFAYRKCGPGEGLTQPTESETRDGKRLTIICSDRIEAMKSDGTTQRLLALSSARMGTDMARLSLRSARRAIESQSELTAEQRTQALAGVDQALAELETRNDD